MGVLDEVEGVIRATQGALEVAQEGIDRAELRQRGAGPAPASDHALVVGTDHLHRAEAPQTIRDHRRRRRDRVSGESRHLLSRELKIRAELNRGIYPIGLKITDAELSGLNLKLAKFHGDWNYTLLPHANQLDQLVFT